MNEIAKQTVKLKTSILLLILCLFTIKVKTQTKAITPKQCVEQYMSWKNDPMEINPDDFFHHKLELHWLEGDKWYKGNGQDYIQKIQAGIFLERQQELLSVQLEKKIALARLQEVFPEDQMVANETLRLEKHRGYWQIREILITYPSTKEIASTSPYRPRTHFTQN